ncbi:MAG TPA: hypothetical protein VF126_06610 [Acidobacteriaceae bacterium]
MTRSARLAGALEAALVLIFAFCLWAPWDRATDATSSSLNMLWLSLPMMLSHRGMALVSVTLTVTICALVISALGALLAILGRARGTVVVWAVGMFLFACSAAILMPGWTAVGFLGAALLLLALRVRFTAMEPMRTLAAVLRELWPLGYAISFAVLAWRYNPQYLIRALMIAFGLSLVARALLPSQAARLHA